MVALLAIVHDGTMAVLVLDTRAKCYWLTVDGEAVSCQLVQYHLVPTNEQSRFGVHLGMKQQL